MIKKKKKLKIKNQKHTRFQTLSVVSMQYLNNFVVGFVFLKHREIKHEKNGVNLILYIPSFKLII